MRNKYEKWEEDHWQELAEGFIKKHEALWIDYVDMMYQEAHEEPDFDDNACDDDYEEPNPEDR